MYDFNGDNEAKYPDYNCPACFIYTHGSNVLWYRVNSSVSDPDYEPRWSSLDFNKAVHNVCLITWYRCFGNAVLANRFRRKQHDLWAISLNNCDLFNTHWNYFFRK